MTGTTRGGSANSGTSRGSSRGGRRTLADYSAESKAPVSRPLVNADEYLAATEGAPGSAPADTEEPPPNPQEGARPSPVPEPGAESQPSGPDDQDKDDAAEDPAGTRTVVLLTAPGADIMGLPESVNLALAADLPAPTAPPTQIIEGCERRIDAVLSVNASIDRRKAEFLLEFAGPAVRLAKATESWRHRVNPETGRPFRSFRAWHRKVGISHAHAYRMIDEKPVADALAPVHTGTLAGKQVEVLAPILRNHGEGAVRKTWETAQTTGSTSASALTRARDMLGYVIQPEQGDEDDDPPADGKEVAALRINPGKVDFGKVREVSRSAPDVWRAIARTILDEVGDGEDGGTT